MKDSIYSFYLYFISIITGCGGLFSLLHGFNKDQPSPVCRPPLSFSEDRSPANGPELHTDHLQHTHVPASAQKTHRGYVSEASLPMGFLRFFANCGTATVYLNVITDVMLFSNMAVGLRRLTWISRAITHTMRLNHELRTQ